MDIYYRTVIVPDIYYRSTFAQVAAINGEVPWISFPYGCNLKRVREQWTQASPPSKLDLLSSHEELKSKLTSRIITAHFTLFEPFKSHFTRYVKLCKETWNPFSGQTAPNSFYVVLPAQVQVFLR